MNCLCPATDGFFCYFREKDCPSPYYWDSLGGGWGYCLASPPTASTRVRACVGASLPPDLAAAIQRDEQYRIDILSANETSQKQMDGTILGSIFGIFGGVGVLALAAYLYRRRRQLTCSCRRTRKDSNADTVPHLEEIAMRANIMRTRVRPERPERPERTERPEVIVVPDTATKIETGRPKSATERRKEFTPVRPKPATKPV